MRLGRWVGLSLGAVLAAAGCAKQDIPPPEAVQQQLELVAFDDCSSMEKYIQDTAVLDMRTTIQQYKEGASRGGPIWFGDGAPTAEAGGNGSGGGRGDSPGAHTGTNNQVSGVDEADFVKNDGTRIFVLSGRKLYLNRSWPADQLATLSTLEIEGWPQEMFLDDENHVVVFSAVYTPGPQQDGSGGGRPDVGSGGCSPWSCWGLGSTTTKMTVVDVSDLANPRVVSELYQPGWYANSRRVGQSVRLVLSNSFRHPEGIRWYPEFTTDLYNDRAARARAFDELMNRNERLIRAQKLDAWLPKAWYKAKDGSLVQVDYDCREFHRANAPTKLGVLSVATLDLSSATLAAHGRPTVTRTSVVSEVGEVYSSATGLYVATRHWWWWPQPGQEDHTYLHKFDLTDPAGARYVTSGGVEGYILNQFAMDEKDGYLRVATTLSRRIDDPSSPWGRVETKNRLSVLGVRGGRLQVVGRTPDLAESERIFSARFVGNRGFVVTFRQVDPLFTFDLSNPENPRKVGELKIPGFSTYLHPVDENHLIGVGEHVPEDPAAPRTRAIKLSMYDVTDFAHPREKFTQLVGTSSGWSSALYDHKAFNYFPERKLLAIPFSDWDPAATDYWTGFRSDLRVFSVDANSGFTPRGALSMRDVYQQINQRNWTWYWTPAIRRSVMADDFVYAISDGGIRVANVNSLDQPISTVVYPPSFYY